MARNEEKQLARLNRWYLQKQRDEEATKRPPRPKLDSLNTAEDVKKWIPTITRDISFYVKQMEVPCYPDHVIEEFSQRIDRLRGEYKAFLRKLRQLCPEETLTPWIDRPYSGKRKKLSDAHSEGIEQKNTSHDSGSSSDPTEKDRPLFVPLKTPVLNSDKGSNSGTFYAYATPASVPNPSDFDDEQQNQPLDFQPHPKSDQDKTPIPDFEMRSHESTVVSSEVNNLPLEQSGRLSSERALPKDERKEGSTGDDVVATSCEKESKESSMTPTHLKVVDVSSDPSARLKPDSTDSSLSPLSRKRASFSVPTLNLPYTDSSSGDSDDYT